MESWLASLDLGHHLAAFTGHGITLDQRADLTDADLRELGLTIGERVRYRHAVAALAAAPVPAASPLLETTRAERRPLTMMFVDLVNSSGLAERLEQEDLLETIRGYREFCNDAVVRFGGHVAQFVGDGILAYFCYPVASENDPERAVRAALRIVRGIAGLPVPMGTGSGETGLAVRIGIATGRVIVSDLFTGGKADKASIIGATPNLAARLQALAPRNGIAIADETHQRVQARFDCRGLGPQTLAGFAQPANCWIVRDEITAPGPADRRARRLTPFFSRAPELAMLDSSWARAERGDGCALLVTGEAGIGKSRLVENFLETRLPEAARTIQLNGSAFAEDSPFHPCIAWLRTRAGIDPAARPAASRERLARIFTGDAPAQAGDLPILADLLGIGDPGSQTAKLQPEQLRARTLSIMLAHLLRQSETEPLCLVVEDAHWLDPSTHELLGLVLDRVAGRRMLVLLTTRDGVAPALAEKALLLRLTRLAPEDVAGMIGSLFQGRTLPGELTREIARKTDGVPLFVEEVARSLLLRKGLTDSDAAWRTELIEELDQSVPASLRESLMGRLDRSGAAKEIAQIAAVVGRSVGRDMLSTVSGMAAPALDQALGMLVEAGVIDRDFTTSESYSFRHALLRDAAYDSLVREHRRDLHFRVARALQSLDEALTGSRPDVLALHLTEAGLAETAAEHWLEAARRSLARSALTEATRLLNRGLTALERLPATPETLRLRLQLSVLLGPALLGLRGPGSDETRQLYLRASELCRDLPEEPSDFPIHWGLWRVTADFRAKTDQAQTMLRRAQRQQAPEFIMQAHHCSWASCYFVGDYDGCAAHVKAGLALYHEGDYRHHASLYGNHDAKACAHGELAQVLWMQGNGRTALREERRSLEWAVSLDHLGSHVHAMDFSILHRVYRGDHASVLRQAEELIEFTSEAGLADMRSKGLIFRGWTVAAQGDVQAGLAAFREGLARQHEIGTSDDFPVYVCMLADVLIAAGHPEEAIQVLQDARAQFDGTGLKFWMPEVLRTQGEAILAAAPEKFAEADLLFAQAGGLAGQQGAAMLALRVAMSQARLDISLDRKEQTAAQLGAALAALPEPEGAEVIEAGRILTSIGASIGSSIGAAVGPSIETGLR